jgi:ectoine hydroxylase-related dioxygenase (phytanoyl-CoA dioxygenase family)
MMMTDDERRRFEDDGYLVVPDLLGHDELAACRADVDRLHDLYRDRAAAGEPPPQFQLEPYAAAPTDGDRPVLRKIEQTDTVSAVFRELASHPRIIDRIVSVLGADVLLFRSTLMLKPARHGSAHGLHQDSAYWPLTPPTQVTVSVALTDATPENGCFRVIPGSHRWDLQDTGRIWRRDDETIEDGAVGDIADQLLVPLAAGSALFFQSRLMHGSGPNKSDSPRNTALYAYFPPTVTYRPAAGAPTSATYRVITGMHGAQSTTFEAVS